MKISESNRYKSALIIYHGPHCNDGFTAAWVTFNALADSGYSKIHLYPMGYGAKQLAELESFLNRPNPYDDIFVVDFSLPLAFMERAKDFHPAYRTKFLVLDHHKTAFEMYWPGVELKEDTALMYASADQRVRVHMDNAESGASLCWNYFNPEKPMPWLVAYVKDRDIWQFKLQHTRAVHMYITTLQKTLVDWEELHSSLERVDLAEDIVAIGEKLLAEYQTKVAELVADAFPCNLKRKDGSEERGLGVECEGQYASDVGNVLAELAGTYGMTYFQVHSEDEEVEDLIHVSLRSNGDYDVEEIAKNYGGGGHKNASGFVLTTANILEILGIKTYS